MERLAITMAQDREEGVMGATNGVKAMFEHPPTKPKVVLEMPYDVAVTLASLVGNVLGSKQPNYREDTDAIYDALLALGVEARVSERMADSIRLNDR